MCPSCQHIYSFNAIEEFFNTKDIDAKRKQIDLFVGAKPTVCIYSRQTIDDKAVTKDELQPGQLAAVCAHLGIENIDDAAFDGLHLLCNVNENRLYFPMQDEAGRFVGYKILSRESNGYLVEDTVPPTNSFGLIVVAPQSAGKRVTKENAKAAIVVLNVIDVLAIRTQKTNGLFQTNGIFEDPFHIF